MAGVTWLRPAAGSKAKADLRRGVQFARSTSLKGPFQALVPHGFRSCKSRRPSTSRAYQEKETDRVRERERERKKRKEKGREETREKVTATKERKKERKKSKKERES